MVSFRPLNNKIIVIMIIIIIIIIMIIIVDMIIKSFVYVDIWPFSARRVFLLSSKLMGTSEVLRRTLFRRGPRCGLWAWPDHELNSKLISFLYFRWDTPSSEDNTPWYRLQSL